MSFANPKNLQLLAISTQKPALKMSKLPSILARAEALHTVVILNGATDHILRLLGLNCNCMQLLDISHSQAVTDKGLRNLLMKQPRKRSQNGLEWPAENMKPPLNACASTLIRIVTLGTDLTSAGYEFGCKLLDGYALSFIPDAIIYRPTEDTKIIGFILDVGNFLVSHEISKALGLSRETAEGVERTAARFVDKGSNRDHLETNQIVDLYTGKKEGEGRMFIRPPDSRIPQAYLKMEWNTLTQLILPWSSFTWRIPALPDVTELATTLPNLTVLKARLQGFVCLGALVLC
jgi:hypothetical protein